jgi:LysM repeat protein
LSLRLRTSVEAIVAVTLVVAAAVLALFPAAADAQTSAPTEDGSAPSVVVRPGDSLWSISEERLGPNATPQRVAEAAERIHALNRGRIGADPDLIFVGQELSLPPALSERPTGASAAPKSAPRGRGRTEGSGGRGTTGGQGAEADPEDRAGGRGRRQRRRSAQKRRPDRRPNTRQTGWPPGPPRRGGGRSGSRRKGVGVRRFANLSGSLVP